MGGGGAKSQARLILVIYVNAGEEKHARLFTLATNCKFQTTSLIQFRVENESNIGMMTAPFNSSGFKTSHP